jgi:hypothetical protein
VHQGLRAKFRPSGHQLAALLKQVAALVSTLGLISIDVGQGGFRDLARKIRSLCGPIAK